MMKTNELPHRIKKEIYLLKHGNKRIESGVKNRLANAEDIKEFQRLIKLDMDALISEANNVIKYISR